MSWKSILRTQYIISKGRLRPGEFLRSFLIEDFGCEDFSVFSLNDLRELENIVHDNLKNIWRQCVAEELLRLKTIGSEVPGDVLSHFGDASPFGNGITLSRARQREWAMAVIPLALEGREAGGLAHLWVSKKDEASGTQSLAGLEIIPKTHSLQVISITPFSGESWQLGFALALYALEKKDDKLRNALINRWIVSGKMEDIKGSFSDIGEKLGAKIAKVVFGNKVIHNSHKRYLFPAENAEANQLARLEDSSKISFATTLGEARNRVKGEGSFSEPDQVFTGEVDELHSFVSGAWNIVVLLALAFSPKKLVLWHTDNHQVSELPAQYIKQVINKLRGTGRFPQLPEILLRPIVSNDVVMAENQLREYFGNRPSISKGSKILFNITQGNILMRLALQDLALEYQEMLPLIYKDLDNSHHFQYVQILRRENNWSISTIACDPKPKEIKWNSLVARFDKKTDPESMVAKLLA